MKKNKTKNPLIKRVPRELKGDWSKYLLVSLFMIFVIGCIAGMYVANESMLTAATENTKKSICEDGHFELSKKAKKANRTLLFYTDYGPQTTVTGSKKKGPNLRRSRPERGARRGSGTETPYPPIFGRQAFFPRERLRMSRKIATFVANKPYLHYGIRRNRLQNTARDEGNVGTR